MSDVEDEACRAEIRALGKVLAEYDPTRYAEAAAAVLRIDVLLGGLNGESPSQAYERKIK